MEQFVIREGEDFIKLGQLLKAVGMAESGADAKALILDEYVKVNGEVCIQRGRKIYDGDIVELDDKSVKVICYEK